MGSRSSHANLCRALVFILRSMESFFSDQISKFLVSISQFGAVDGVILALLYPPAFSCLVWPGTVCHLWHLTCSIFKRLANQETSEARTCRSWADCRVLMFCSSLLPLFVVSRKVCSWINVGFLDSRFLCFFFFFIFFF